MDDLAAVTLACCFAHQLLVVAPHLMRDVSWQVRFEPLHDFYSVFPEKLLDCTLGFFGCHLPSPWPGSHDMTTNTQHLGQLHSLQHALNGQVLRALYVHLQEVDSAQT